MYTYAFIKTPNSPLELPPGIAGNLKIISLDHISAVVEPEVDLNLIETILQNDEQLQQAYLRYGVVICELFRQITLLPLKFYHCFKDQDSLEHHLKINQQYYLSQLERFHNQGEYILKLFPQQPPEPPLPQVSKGRDYFLAKKQHYQLQQDFKLQQAYELEQILKIIAQTYSPNLLTNLEKEVPQIYILASLHDKALLRQHFQTWQNYCQTWEMELGEAIPPYDFLTT